MIDHVPRGSARRVLDVLAPALATLLIAAPASADQAEWLDRDESERVLSFLRDARAVRLHCAPCGETTSEWQAITSLYRVVAFEEQLEIRVNDEPVDAAYTYVRHDGRWTNLAMLAEVPVDAVPRYLEGALAGPDPAALPGSAIATAPTIPSGAVRVDEHCFVFGDRLEITLVCARPDASYTAVLGMCSLATSAELATTPGVEAVLTCELGNRDGMTVVASSLGLQKAYGRWELEGHRIEIRDVVPNGDGVLELLLHSGTEDGDHLEVVASRGDEFVEVFSHSLGGGMGEDSVTRVEFPPGPAPIAVVRRFVGRRSTTQRWPFDAERFAFVPPPTRRRR